MEGRGSQPASLTHLGSRRSALRARRWLGRLESDRGYGPGCGCWGGGSPGRGGAGPGAGRPGRPRGREAGGGPPLAPEPGGARPGRSHARPLLGTPPPHAPPRSLGRLGRERRGEDPGRGASPVTQSVFWRREFTRPGKGCSARPLLSPRRRRCGPSGLGSRDKYRSRRGLATQGLP